jgi:hypothetical protein
MTMHEIQLEFERIYAERYCYDDDTAGARLHALRAVAPMLIAQGMREAALLLHGGELAYFIDGKIENLHSNLDAVVILNRAQELDPQ